MSVIRAAKWKYVFILVCVVFGVSACDNFELVERGQNAGADRGSSNPPAQETVGTPTFNPVAGTVASGTSVAISTTTAGATLYYTLDGSEPGVNSTEYNSPVALGDGNRTLKAIGVLEGYQDSTVASADYTVGGIDQTLFQEKNGLVVMEAEASQEIVAGATDSLQWNILEQDDAFGGALIQAPDTTEKTDVSADNTRADYKIYFTNPGTYYLFLRGLSTEANRSVYFGLSGAANDTPASFEFTSEADTNWVWENNAETQGVASIQIPAQGEYTFTLWMKSPNLKIDQIILSTNPDYLPGKDPTDPTDPAVAQAPTFDPEGGTLGPGAEVYMASTTPGTSIFYTIDGSDPDAFSTQYNGSPITLELGKTDIRAIAMADGLADSPVASASYTVTATDASREFQEEGGLVVMEGENASLLTAADTRPPFYGEAWKRVDIAGATGGAVIQLPYMTVGVGREDHARGPRADYLINFSTAGTYYLWLRGQKSTNAIGSLYVGIDGELLDIGLLPVNNFFKFRDLGDWKSRWQWDNSEKTQVHAIQIDTPGVYTLNLWMRYNGLVVDKILLSNEAAFIPSDEGPAESPSNGGIPALPAPAMSPEGGVFTGAVEVSLSSTGAANIYYTTDGSLPSSSSTLYTGPFTLNNTATVQAIAIRPGFVDSSVISAGFTAN
ncbi:hypothetical protein FT643_13495 [Ketobacter sp. MCCC 1A13808]|uniref:chitobiase/beta-hexosaminidase C-terminal domain-containing protein n=1 Tax=Ketobacter sp. MCCC 1A13808 TaxID=2602738 RepID=UPI0012EBD68E|nr:chitobiase/beta-hexosaminidase C-terminal domain-containing protein [Ketobacter sp. MCCC 1A13808]MVF13150.1 hypothetical protein [Ketobacter sp. MCCC 1A13808]